MWPLRVKIPTQYLLRLFCFTDVDAEKQVYKSLVEIVKMKFDQDLCKNLWYDL